MTITRAGVDTYVSSARAAKNFGTAPRVFADNGVLQTLTRLKPPAPNGSTILSAELVYTQAAGFSGTVSATAQLLAAPFSARQVTWNGRPTAVSGPTTTLTKTSPAAGTEWAFDVTAQVQLLVNGRRNDGWRITTDVAADLAFFSMQAASKRPYLRVTWSQAPIAPTRIRPGVGDVSIAKPVVQCDFTDRAGATRMRAMQVQIDPTADWAGVDFWDSGTVLTSEPVLDLAATTYPGLADGQRTSMRVRVQDTANLWSPWSDAVTFGRKAKGTLSITSPGPNGTGMPFVTEYTPPVVWSATLPTGLTPVAYQVRVFSLDRLTVPLYDSGKLPGSGNSTSIPRRVLRGGVTHRLVVRVWDSWDEREATAGDPAYIEATRDFVVLPTSTQAPVTGLTATQLGDAPWVELMWNRATAPDSYTVLRDGQPIAADVPPGDVLTSSTAYRFVDYGARPHVLHTYEVRAEVNGDLTGSPAASVKTAPLGIWLLDPNTGLDVALRGADFRAESPDRAETFPVLGSTEVVRSVMAVTGRVGSCSGLVLQDEDEATWEVAEARLNDWKGRPADEFRLVIGEDSMPVVLGDLLIHAHPDTRARRVLRLVSFSWWQTGDHDFVVRY